MRFARTIHTIAAASMVAVTASAQTAAAQQAVGTSAAQQAAVDLTGAWDLTVVTDNGTGNSVLTIKQQGDSISGTYESVRMGSLPFKGTVKEKTFQFALDTEGGAKLTFAGTIDDADNIKGNVDFAGMGGATFTGKRKK